MTNDLSTLSGALLEMKDQLIYELGQKGVTASYDSTTGLLGLIGEISNIQQGGGSCYHIEFSEASYIAVGGSATLEIYLQENYQPKSGATVTVTGSDSSSYTCITNSSGIGSCTVTGVSASTTFTASYSNVSDTATVVPMTYIFYDDCSVDHTSLYTEAYDYWELQSSFTFNVAFDTDHYVISHTDGGFMGVPLPNLTAPLDNYVFTADVLATGTNTDYGAGIGIIKRINNGTGQGMVQPNSNSSNRKHTYLTNTENRGSVLSQVVTTNYVLNNYHTHRLTKQGTSITYEILYNNNVIFTKTNTVNNTLATETVPCLCIGRWETGAKFKNIKVESL